MRSGDKTKLNIVHEGNFRVCVDLLPHLQVFTDGVRKESLVHTVCTNTLPTKLYDIPGCEERLENCQSVLCGIYKCYSYKLYLQIQDFLHTLLIIVFNLLILKQIVT